MDSIIASTIEILNAGYRKSAPVKLSEILGILDAQHHAIATLEELNEALRKSYPFRIQETSDEVTLVPTKDSESDIISQSAWELAYSVYAKRMDNLITKIVKSLPKIPSLGAYRKALLGLPVSHVWRGHGSALFVEFGELHAQKKQDGSMGNPTGEVTLMIEWSWRIEKPRSILGGSWSSERRWPGMFQKLIGAKVTDLQIVGHLPEIEVLLSNGLRIVSFMTGEGQPAWALICRTTPKLTLCVRKGKLYEERAIAEQIE